MKVMLMTSSFTTLSNPSRLQASWVNALSWWEVKLKLRFFMGSSIGAVKGGKKKNVKEERRKINSACACERMTERYRAALQ